MSNREGETASCSLALQGPAGLRAWLSSIEVRLARGPLVIWPHLGISVLSNGANTADFVLFLQNITQYRIRRPFITVPV